MPELPEVETVVRALRRAILGARIVNIAYSSRRVAAGNSRGWKAALAGSIIESISRRGKYIDFHLGARGHLIAHLRMTGRFRLHPVGTKRGKYDRLVVAVEGGELAEPSLLTLVDTRQFARADFLPSASTRSHPGIVKLGPEADRITETQLRRLLAKSRRPIKSLLLDQTAIAGLGNIYADECLHASGIHPLTASELVDRGQIRRLRTAMQRILTAAIEACGTTFDTFSDLSGDAGGFAPYLLVYSRMGQCCLTCGSTIERVVLSGRSAHYCPRCQPRQG
jgi:formamidopyrimidine-DNA glycosylase